MDAIWKQIVWGQFGAAIDTLENAINACPDNLWADRSKRPEFWHVAYHTLFWLDFYLTESTENFAPPPPITAEDLDPSGLMPKQPFTKVDLLAYLEHGREKGRATIAGLNDEQAARIIRFGSIDLSFGELLLYIMRHVQHHAAQLNLILRQTVDSAPRWVFRAAQGLK